VLKEAQLGQLAAMLPPRQQRLDFAKSTLWERLPKRDQRACRDALAKLLYQTIQPNDEDDET
jgi:hypothetical protein